MKSPKLDKIIRDFLITEGDAGNPSVKSRLLTLEELLGRIEGRSLAEVRRLEIIREQVKAVKREVKRLEENIQLLEEEKKELQEKLMLLEENKEEK